MFNNKKSKYAISGYAKNVSFTFEEEKSEIGGWMRTTNMFLNGKQINFLEHVTDKTLETSQAFSPIEESDPIIIVVERDKHMFHGKVCYLLKKSEFRFHENGSVNASLIFSSILIGSAMILFYYSFLRHEIHWLNFSVGLGLSIWAFYELVISFKYISYQSIILRRLSRLQKINPNLFQPKILAGIMSKSCTKIKNVLNNVGL